jgi:tetratricopeptide (TPR) repeat protein
MATYHFSKHTIWLCLLLFFSLPSFAQKGNKSKGDKFKDTVQVNQLVNIATAYSVEKPDMALHFGIRALEMARLMEYEGGITESWRILGKICHHMGQYELALDYQQQALDVYERTKNQKLKAVILNDMAAVLTNMKEYEQAMNYKLKAIKIEDKAGNQETLAQSYNQMGALYADLGNYDLALKYCEMSLHLREGLKDKTALADSYGVMGLVHGKSRHYVEALEYMKKALQLNKELNNLYALGALLSNIGDIYTKLGKAAEASSYYEQSLGIEEEQGSKKGSINSLMNLGKNYIELKNYALAKQYLLRALELSKETNAKEQTEFCYGYLSEAYEKSGNYAEALANYKLYTDYQKKIYDESNYRKIAEMHDLIESERNDKEVALLNKDKKIKDLELEKMRAGQYVLVSFIAFLLIICGLVIIFARNKNIQQQKLGQ